MEDSLRIYENSISNHYKVLDKIGNLGETPDKGFLRAGYFPEEQEAIKYFADKCQALGLSCRYDQIGNFSAETSSESGKFIEFGSHVDTVPYGGNYDGLAGVVAGFEAIRSHVENKSNLKHGLRLRIWRLEESSTFNLSCFGSKAAFGKVDAASLENVFSGTTLKNAMLSLGYDPEVLAKKQQTISQSELDSILAHFELHIEQANVLELNQNDIGIITSIRGPKNIRFEIEGAFDHSGGTPLGRPYRRDANLAMAYMHVRLDELIKSYIEKGHDIIHTVGIINSQKSENDKDFRVYNSSAAKVCGYAYFVLNVRAADDELRERYIQDVFALLNKTAEEFGVVIKSKVSNESPGVKQIAKDNQIALETACKNLNLKYEFMPSGAMHDCAVLGQQKNSLGENIPVGMIFIPCKDGISHSPLEFASSADIAKGANVLCEVVRHLGG